MPAAVHANPATAVESKSARKKKAKAEAASAATAGSATPDGERAASIAGVEDGKSESAGVQHLRELQKQQRNLSKKLAATQRVDAIISANPGKSLEELVATKLINLDQKAQAERKPQLQSQLETVDGQIAQFKKIEASYYGVFAQEKQEITANHAREMEDMRQQVEARVKGEMETQFRDRLLLISQFLKAAATRRNKEDAEASDPDGRAFEGVLSSVYYGDASAVAAFEKLLGGSKVKVTDWQGEVDVTYARVKQLTLQEAAVEGRLDETIPADTREATAGATSILQAAEMTDSTVANAVLTEMTSASPLQNGTVNHGSEDSPTKVPPSGSIGARTGNAAAEELWDTAAAGDSTPEMEDSYEVIPRPAEEVEFKDTHLPAAMASTSSWADEAEASSAGLDGVAVNGGGVVFQEVHHRRGRGRGGFRSEGQGRGRGGRGGELRGRGRGGRGGDFREESRSRGRGGRGGRTD